MAKLNSPSKAVPAIKGAPYISLDVDEEATESLELSIVSPEMKSIFLLLVAGSLCPPL